MIDLIRKTLRLLKRSARRRLALSAVLSIALAVVEVVAIGLVLPFVQALTDEAALAESSTLRRLGDALGAQSNEAFITRLGALIAILFVLRSVASVVFVWWQMGFLARFEAELSEELAAGYLRGPYQFHLDNNSSRMMHLVYTATVSFFSNVVQGMLAVVSDGLLIVLVLGLLIVVEPLIAGLTVVFFGIVAVGYYFAINRRAERLGAEAQRLGILCLQVLREGLEGIKDIKVAGVEDHFLGGFSDARAEWAAVRRRQQFLPQLPRYYLETAMITSVIVLSIVLVNVGSADRALSVLGLFAVGGFRVLPAVNRVLGGLHSMNMGAAATAELAAEVDRLPARSVTPKLQGRAELHGALELRNISFRYSPDAHDVLHDVSLAIGRGESIGVVGPSGAGKTTLIDIVLGLFPPTSGSVLVDGEDVTADLAAWRRMIAYVPQTIYLRDASVRANIAFGVDDADIDDARVHDAIRRAQLDDLVASLPQGIDTNIGERGVRLSGGERQRLGIGRALYREPQVLVLDEATSSLDSETESRIAATVEELRGDKTLLIVAHRLSTVRACDRLVLIEAGRVTATGTFDELASSSARFAELIRLGQLLSAESDRL